MKILLVSLNNYEVNRGLLYLPLGLYYLRGYLMKHDLLRRAVSCKIKTYNSSISNRELLRSILSERSQIVGFSCWCWNILQILEVSHLVKKVDPSIKIILGGPQASSIKESEALLQSSEAIDIVAHGEGEITFTKLIQPLLTGEPSLHDIEGISFREGLKIKRANRIPPFANLDDIPLDISSEEIQAFDLNKTVFLLETQRGCPFKCKFCYYRKGYQRVRFFSAEKVKENIKFLLDNGVKRLYLADPTFNINLKRAKEILRFIVDQEKEIILNTEIKAEFVDEEFGKLLFQAGTKFLDVGLQSINPRALEAMGRNLNQETFEKGIQVLKGEKIVFQIQLILGLPGDNYEYFCKSLNYALHLVDNNWGLIEVFPLELIPGSEFFDKSLEFGIIHEKSPPYYVIQTSTFSLEDIAKAEELTNSVKGIYSSSLLRALSNSLQQQPTEIAVNWSNWLCENLGFTVNQFNSEGIFNRIRYFTEFVKNCNLKHGVRKNISVIRIYLILVHECFRYLLNRASS